MCQVNIFEAKTGLSKLLVLLENRDEDEVIIARNGKPVVKMIRWEQAPVEKRIGVARALFLVPENIDEDNTSVAHLFSGGLQ